MLFITKWVMWNKIFIITRVLWSVNYYKKGTGFSLGTAPKSCIWTETNILRKTNYWYSLISLSVPLFVQNLLCALGYLMTDGLFQHWLCGSWHFTLTMWFLTSTLTLWSLTFYIDCLDPDLLHWLWGSRHFTLTMWFQIFYIDFVVPDIAGKLHEAVDEVVLISEAKTTLFGHNNRIVGLQWSPHDDNTLASVSFDGTARVNDTYLNSNFSKKIIGEPVMWRSVNSILSVQSLLFFSILMSAFVYLSSFMAFKQRWGVSHSNPHYWPLYKVNIKHVTNSITLLKIRLRLKT